MKKLYSLLLGTLLCITGGHLFGNSWLQRSSLPADARLAPMSFGLNGKVYIVGGQHQVAGSDYDLADCWAYDPTSNTWSQQADYGGGLISRGVAFSIGSLGYVGYGTVFPAGQLWAYDPAANQWTQKASAPIATPTAVRILSAAFTVAGKAYVCGGLDTAIRSDLWEYDPVMDTWTQRTSFPGGGRYGAIAFSANDKGYFGTGTNGANEQQDMWAYDPQDDTWVQLGNFPGAVRTNAAAFSIGTRGFVHGGVDVGVASYNELWEFNALNGSWTQRASNVTRYLATATSLGNKGYFGMGNLGANFNDWWEYTPDPVIDCLGILNGTTFPGTGCNDGNSCTVNDVIDAACQCTGTYQDTDGDGLCNANDPCPLFANGPGSTFAEAIDLGVATSTANALLGNGCFSDRYNPNSIPGSSYATHGKDRFYRFTTNTCGSGLTIQLCEPTNPPGVIAMHILSSNGSNLRTILKQPFDPCLFVNPLTAPDVFAPNTVYYLVVESDDNLSNYLLTILPNAPGPDTDGDGTCDLSDDCPNAPGTIGSPCNDGNASTTNDLLNANCVCAGTPTNTANWVQRADFGGGGRGGGFSFALAGKGFVGGGSNSGGATFNDTWTYDPGSNAWNQIASLPVTGATGGLGFSIGGTGYVYVTEVNALWAYDPNSNSWNERAPFPGGPRSRPFGFSLGAYGYMGGGFSYGPLASMNDFWRYDPSSDSWLQRADLSGVARSGSASFTVDGLGYVFGGADDAFNVLGDLQAYDPVANTWNSRAPLPSTGRRWATGFSIGHAGYVAGGSTSSFIRLNECWEYQPGNNVWNAAASPGPEGRDAGMAFTIGMQGYLVGGYAGGANTTIADMRMYTQDPQPDCNGVVGGTNYPGTPCNDGNATTTSDVFDANCICAGTPSTNSWVQRADFGGGGRAQPFSFTLNDIGYVGGGFFSPFGLDISDDVWAYDPSIDTWSQVADFGGGVNAASATFVVNGKGYVVGGLNSGGEVNELWAYDPMVNTWIPRAPIPNSARRRPIAFALNGLGFAGTGSLGPTMLNDFWAYDPVSDTWSPRANAPAPARWFATSFTVDGIGYLCGGADETFNDLTDLHAYDPITNSWTGRASFPGASRRAAIGFSIGHAGYVACGLGALERFNDCYEYRPGLDSWIEVTAPGPQPRSSAAAFTIADKAFLVGGYSGDPVATIADMRMYTQNIQPDCYGVVGGTNYPGTPCDDGLAYTENDALNGLCICRGTCVNDADGDGLCDEVDNCPSVLGQMGAPCNDNNACTINDALDGSCNCTGTFADSDGDGICDAADNCPTLTGQQGGACDDGNANTTNDLITAACTCAGTPVINDAWTQQAAFSGFPRESAVAFTIGGYGYMGTGQDGTTFYNDLWRYDPASDSWAQMADIDVTGRSGAYAFAVGGFGYVGDGIDQNVLYIADLRQYDPASNSWAWLFAFSPGGQGRYRAVSFSANGKGYMGSGQNTFGPTDDFWEFDPVTLNWAQMPNMPGGQRSLATAFAIGNKGYAGTGSSGPGVVLNDFYEFDALTLTWSPKSNFGGTARGSAVGFALAGKGYLGTGQDASGTLQDFWEYDPTTDTWTLRAPLPGPQRLAASAFTVDGRAYVSMGSNSNGVLGDVWEYTPDGVTCTVGDPCDDGLAYTQNDSLTANCTCAGACITDSDGDGTCDEVDVCPYQALPIGSACDDFNPCTENDLVQPWCGCAGTPLPDSDGDFICDLVDQCPSSPGSIGYSCDDGNPCTANDVIDANCVCAGQIPDANNDGLSDLCNPYVIQTVTNGCSTYMLLSRSNWTNAEAAAVALGGHLATINSASENAFLYSTFTQSGPLERGLWIGFNDAATEDEFVWSSGEANSYTNWTPGEPSNLSGEHYAGIFWPSEPRAPQWFDETNGFLPYGFDVGVYMYGVVEIPAVDTDSDGLCDLQDNCPNSVGQIGSPCDDGFSCTINDVLDATCNCAGTPVPDGTMCGDNAQCLAGTCQPACTENVTIELRTDLNSQQASWVILDQNTNITLCSGGGYPPNINAPIVENCCLPAGCYRLRVSDSGGDGFVSGGYQLREGGANGRRIIDDMGNFNTGSSSSLTSTYENGAFCVPIGSDKPIFTSCDKLDWVGNQFIVASENTSVSAQFGTTNTTSGYEFWFFDPNGTYSFRRFRSHATSDGTGSGALRACHFKLNGWINSAATPHLPANTLLNVRIRGRVAGNNLPFGPVCQFKIDAVRAACPLVKLQDDPSNTSDYSCGVSRVFGGSNSAANKLVAAPPKFIPAVASSNVRYQFRFRLPGEFPAPGSCIVRPVQTSPTLHLNWTTGARLKCNTQYLVDVRVSKNGGATWCVADGETTCDANPTIWGKVCQVNITTSTFCPSGGTGNTCGNGVLDPGESCDDGNLVNGDGCDADCSLTGAAQGGSTNFTPDGGGSSLSVYPNPNRGHQLFVSMTDIDNTISTVTMDVFDMTGKRIVQRTITAQDGFVNQAVYLNSELAAGLYLVNFTAGEQVFSERLVVEP